MKQLHLFILFLLLYTEGVAQNTPSTDLSQIYQDRANWFRHAPQFNRDSTIFYFEKAIETIEKTQPIPYALLTQMQFSLAEYYNYIHSNGQADDYCTKAWDNWQKIADRDKNKLLQYDLLNIWALTLIEKGQLTRALDLFTQAYNLLKEDTHPALQAKVLKDKGVFYSRFALSEERNNSFQDLQKSLKIYQTINDPTNNESIVRIYTLMVYHYFEVEKLDSSNYYTGQIKELLPTFNNPQREAWYGMIAGSAAIKRKEYADAEKHILESMHILETYKINNTDYYQYDLLLLGDIEKIKERYDKAIDYYKKSRAIALAIHNSGSAMDDLASLAFCYEKKGDFAQALAYHKQYSLESEQATKERSKKSLNENELRINLLSKEKELDKQRAQHNLSILAALIALLLVGLLSFFYYRQRKVKNILQEQNALINQQSEALRHLDAAKSRFFANVSHELRTPLTLMLAPLSTMMKSGTLDNKNFTLAGLVKQNTQGLLKLVNEILDLNKLEAGKLTLHEEKTVVYNLIRRIIAGFESSAEANQIHFTFHYQADRYLQLLLDTDKFEKILNNLLSNACKFTKAKGTVTVTVTDEQSFLKIVVADTGRGIHPNDLPHIFNRFYQSNQPDAVTEGGTGIGLSLSMELARLFGGTLSVKSTLGEGSTFVFELPKKEVLGSIQTFEAEEMLQEPIVTEGVDDLSKLKDSHSSHGSKATVLIVEDNQSLRDYLSLILEGHYTILKAENGSVALDILDKEIRPDLILSDVMMPIMDGFQLLSALKTSDVFCSIPVVMLTARAELQDKLKALRIGVDDYLTKPFEEEELLARIENLLTNARLRRSFIENPLMEEGLAVNLGENTEGGDTLMPTHSAADLAWLEQLETLVKQNLKDRNYSVEGMASDMALSRTQLFRKLKLLSGLSPQQYLQEVRFKQALYLLETHQEDSVKAVCYAVGLLQVNHFSHLFHQRFGKTPSSYLK